MNPHDAYTRLLGLALRGGHLAAGSDAVQSAAYAKDVRLLVLSADAAERTRRDARLWAERGQCLCISLPCGKAELGQALGRAEVSVAAVTDTGLAAAVAERLAQLDSARYAETAQRLKQKVRRAAERRMVRARSRPGNGAQRTAPPKRPAHTQHPPRKAAQSRNPRPKRRSDA